MFICHSLKRNQMEATSLGDQEQEGKLGQPFTPIKSSTNLLLTLSLLDASKASLGVKLFINGSPEEGAAISDVSTILSNISET